mmetsp:Transcript_161445/g.518436  ORF Transcript_161445/g.518436 Transcript_161445/m.518436 type:complete len:343 (-) Transcript_161445:3574-4602(-)
MTLALLDARQEPRQGRTPEELQQPLAGLGHEGDRGGCRDELGQVRAAVPADDHGELELGILRLVGGLPLLVLLGIFIVVIVSASLHGLVACSCALLVLLVTRQSAFHRGEEGSRAGSENFFFEQSKRAVPHDAFRPPQRQVEARHALRADVPDDPSRGNAILRRRRRRRGICWGNVASLVGFRGLRGRRNRRRHGRLAPSAGQKSPHWVDRKETLLTARIAQRNRSLRGLRQSLPQREGLLRQGRRLHGRRRRALLAGFGLFLVLGVLRRRGLLLRLQADLLAHHVDRHLHGHLAVPEDFQDGLGHGEPGGIFGSIGAHSAHLKLHHTSENCHRELAAQCDG